MSADNVTAADGAHVGLLTPEQRLAAVSSRWNTMLKKPLGSPVTAPRWFVVYTDPRGEERAVGGLRSLGYAVFAPVETVWRKIPEHKRLPNGPKKEKRCQPLFPRYIFVGLHVGEHSLLPARATDGVADIVTVAGRPVEVSPALIARMQASVGSSDYDQTAKEADALAKLLGQQIQIPEGLFAGFMATVLRIARKTVEVEVSSAGRKFRLTMGLELIARDAA